MKIYRRFNDYGSTNYVAQKGTIASDRRPGTHVWQRDGGKVFVTCRGCDAINDITDHQNASYARFLEPSCFVCTNCRTHYYFTLRGWEQPALISCSICRHAQKFAVGKGEFRRFRKQGWIIDPKNNKSARCPHCAARAK